MAGLSHCHGLRCDLEVSDTPGSRDPQLCRCSRAGSTARTLFISLFYTTGLCCWILLNESIGFKKEF